MPTDPETLRLADEIRKQAHAIAALDVETLVSRPELGEITFESGKDIFEQSIALAREVELLPLDQLIPPMLQQIHPHFLNLNNSLQAISGFRIGGKANPEQERNTLIAGARQHWQSLFTHTIPYLPYLHLRNAQVQETVSQGRNLISQIEASYISTGNAMKLKLEEVESLVRAAKDAVAKVGVGQFATIFESLSTDHDKVANKWLWASVICAGLTGIVALLLVYLFPVSGQLTDAALIQRILTKLIVISLFYFATIWAAKNYRAHRHLAVTNRHRQAALRTFETFVKASEDSVTRDAVLLEATRCVFSHSSTGYLEGHDDSPPSRFIEIFKAVTGGASKANT